MNARISKPLRMSVCLLFMLSLAGPVTAKPGGNGGGNGGGGGKPGGGGASGCDATYDSASDFFPTVLFREHDNKKNRTYRMVFGSANGSCRQVIGEFSTDDSPRDATVWLDANGTSGKVVWKDNVIFSESPVNIRLASFTVVPSSDGTYPAISISQPSLIEQVTDFEAVGVWGMDLSPDGNCLTYLSDPFEDPADPGSGSYSELRLRNVGGAGCTDAEYRIPDTLTAPGPQIEHVLEPRWSPDANAIFAKIVQYDDESIGDESILQIDLSATPIQLTQVIDWVNRVEVFDVTQYDSHTLIAYGGEDSSQCGVVTIVDGTGNGISGLNSFPGIEPIWSGRGALAQPGYPSVFHWSTFNCVGLGDRLSETDAGSLSSVETAYDPSKLYVLDVW